MSPNIKEEYGLSVFKNGLIKNTFWSKREEVRADWRKLQGKFQIWTPWSGSSVAAIPVYQSNPLPANLENMVIS
jgi:hypothetical protein